jgi:hypothetical protein
LVAVWEACEVQRAESRKQKAESRKQKAESKRQKAKGRKQRAKGRRQIVGTDIGLLDPGLSG